MVEQAILDYIAVWPTHGPRRIANELRSESWGGIVVSHWGVYKTLRRRQLHRRGLGCAGTPTTQGLKALEGVFPTHDAPILERLRAAGAIPIGRTKLPSFTLRWHCESELWGATVNPWDRSRTAGASSAGEAAAIATGMSPMGLGNDGPGSLRHPAQCCGVSAPPSRASTTFQQVPMDSSALHPFPTCGV